MSLTRTQIISTASTIVLYNILIVYIGYSMIINFNALNISSKISSRNKFIYFSTIYLTMHICLSFMMALACGYYQLAALNCFLQKNIEKKILMASNEVILKASMMYDKICDAFEAISHYFLINNIVFFASFVFFNIFFHYSVYVDIQISNDPSIKYFVNTALVWSMYFSPAVVWILTFSHWVQSEGCKTADLVNDLANQERNLKTLRIAQRMTMMVAHRKPRITCGLFELNWKSYFAMVGSIFSFTIIIIQFYDVSNF